MPRTVTIGSFSRMTYLSATTLRHYHAVGLLEPARVDEASGYRHYTTDQVPAAHLIRRLRDGLRPRPQITVLVGLETFTGRICELADGTVIAPGLVAGPLDRAAVERVVFDGPDRVIAVGQARLFTGALRRAIEVRDRHCTHPGCAVPAQRCEVDHVIPFAEAGATTQANGVLRCPAHHHGATNNTDDPKTTTKPPNPPAAGWRLTTEATTSLPLTGGGAPSPPGGPPMPSAGAAAVATATRRRVRRGDGATGSRRTVP